MQKKKKQEILGKSLKTRYSVGIFTLQHGLASSPPVASPFLPRCSANSIKLQRDAEAHFLCQSLFLSLAWFWHKGIKLGHFRGFVGALFGGSNSTRGRPSLGVPPS